MTDTPKPTMAALIAAIAMAHTQPTPLDPEPPAQVKRKDPPGPKFYNRRKFQYIKRKRKLAHAARRRNRR